MPLVDIRGAVPFKVNEYTKANKIDTEPAFAWWVPYIPKTHTKYGIPVPKTSHKALAIDQENGNNAWSDAIKKEMQNIAPDFKIKAKDKRIRNKYKYVGFYMVYKIKILCKDPTKRPRPKDPTQSYESDF